MKQHITVKQLKELEKEKVLKIIDSSLQYNAKQEICRRHFNIGKMIEVLEPWHISIDSLSGGWETTLFDDDYKIEKEFYKNELADALWQAVKYVLGKR